MDQIRCGGLDILIKHSWSMRDSIPQGALICFYILSLSLSLPPSLSKDKKYGEIGPKSLASPHTFKYFQQSTCAKAGLYNTLHEYCI